MSSPKGKIYLIFAIAGISFAGYCLFFYNRHKELYTVAFINSKQNKLIGDLTFGMEQKEGDCMIEQLNRENKTGPDDATYHNGKFQYTEIKADYDKDSGLYCLRIYGVGNNRKVDDTTILTDMYSKIYGAVDTAASLYSLRPKLERTPFI